MEIIPKYCDITVSDSNIQSGCLAIDETKSNLVAAYEELVESNASMLKELTGDVKTAFTGAKDTTEKRVTVVVGVFGSLSTTLTEYSNKNLLIDLDAGALMGGERNE